MYCNYSKDKFGNSVTFILPPWVNIDEGTYDIEWDKLYGSCTQSVNDKLSEGDSWWFWNSAIAERDYFKLIGQKWLPQQARSILPNSLKTELIMTGFAKDWEHFFSLRSASSAHPQARELSIPLEQEFKNRNYI